MSSKPPGRRGPKPASVTDWHLWAEVKKTIAPLPKRFERAPTDRDALNAALNAHQPAPSPVAPASPRTPQILKPTGPAVPAHRPVFTPSIKRPLESGIEPNLKHRLVKGRLPIDATLDLHGMTQDAAYGRLLAFIPARAARGDRTVLVITGKGLKKTGYLQIEQRGILRNAVPQWLSEPPLRQYVSGIDTAHTGHGGEGALYVRLKPEQKRENRR